MVKNKWMIKQERQMKILLIGVIVISLVFFSVVGNELYSRNPILRDFDDCSDNRLGLYSGSNDAINHFCSKCYDKNAWCKNFMDNTGIKITWEDRPN